MDRTGLYWTTFGELYLVQVLRRFEGDEEVDPELAQITNLHHFGSSVVPVSQVVENIMNGWYTPTTASVIARKMGK